MVRYLDFSLFHNKRPPTGSTYLRMIQLEKYWEDFKRYKYGENPDVLIFQKVYCSADYKFPAQFEKTKILDICDADWLIGMAVKETVDAVDAVVTSTEPLAEFIKQLTDKPVIVVPDRFDLDLVPERKKHSGKAKNAVWFGYAHNAEALKYGINSLARKGINLTVISNEDPTAYRWTDETYKDQYNFIKYDEQTIYQELQKADFAFLPKNNRPEDEFKSNNRTIKAQLAGLPVVTDKETLEQFYEGKEREQWAKTYHGIICKEYNVVNSVNQYKELIESIK
jgi:adenylate kinase family enzyme